MRILAIRGCNLASLAGEFEIDLASGALGGAGVFAIVGPTGAGKSTLLDAMCVALFDRTPRLTNHSRVVVGRGDDDPTAIGAQDVRTLLRRGASSGWAEVDFESGDARRYRARWSVRRARGATDGRFQNQQVTLAALDRSGLVAEQLGGTKTETLEAIHQRLGLTFDQFRRSALLAQGEFAAFLRADGKDRSELLERMTGTEIYSQLSIAAHVKAALAEQQLRERQGAALQIAILSPEARTQAEADLALAKDAQAATRARLATAESAARWLAEAKSRQRALVEAETARSGAEQAVDAAQVLRAELVLRRRAEAMRPTWDEAAKLDRQLAIAQGELASASDAVARAESAQHEVAERRARLLELHTPIRDARVAAGLRIDERRSGTAFAGARTDERDRATIATGTRGDERRNEAIATGTRGDDRRDEAIAIGTRGDERRDEAIATGTRGDERRDEATAIGMRGDERRDEATAIGMRGYERRDEATAIGTRGDALRDEAIATGTRGDERRDEAISIGMRGDERRGSADARATHGPRTISAQSNLASAKLGARAHAHEQRLDGPRPVTGSLARGVDLSSLHAAFDDVLEGRAVAALSRDAAWLAARIPLADAVAGWRELDAALGQHATLAAEIASADRDLSEHTRRRELLGRQRAAAATEHQQAQAKLAEAQREADAFSKRRGLTLDAARRAEDEARKRTSDFDRLLALTGEARGAATARAELERQLTELAGATSADADARRIAELERDTAATLRTERARVVEELRKAAGYSHARAELVEGEPCALCGATAHPWASRGSFDTLIVDAQDKLAESVSRFERALATLATIDARDNHRGTERQRLTSCLATADRSAKAARVSWRDQLAALGELLLVDDPASDAAKQLADERMVAARHKLDVARTARHQAEAVAKAGADAQALVQTRQNDVQQHARSLGELDKALASNEATIARVRGERAGKVAREVELLVVIDAALVRWESTEQPADVEAAAHQDDGDSRSPSDASSVVQHSTDTSPAHRRPSDTRSRATDAAAANRGPSDTRSRTTVAAAADRGPSDTRSRAADTAAADRGPSDTRTRTSDVAAADRRRSAPLASALSSAADRRPSGSRASALSPAERRAVELAREAIAPVLARVATATMQSSAVPSLPKATRSKAKTAVESSGVVEARVDTSKSERLLAPDALGLLDRCRRALAELVEAWNAHADVVVDLDATLSMAHAEIDGLARDVERAVTEYTARRDACTSRRDAVRDELAIASARLDDARISAGFERAELQRLLADDPRKLDALGEQLDALDRAADRARTLVAERRRLVDAHLAERPNGDLPGRPSGDGHLAGRPSGDGHLAGRPSGDGHLAGRPSGDGHLAGRPSGDRHPAGQPSEDGHDVHDPRSASSLVDLDSDPFADEARRVPELAAAVSAADHQAAALAATLAADADAQRRRADALAELAAAERAAEVDRVLGQIIGSHDGKLFRSFAQSLTLDGLLAVANSHLEELAPRYQLERVPKHDLELQVIDRDLGDEIRSVQTLSGGESFLVSLALALGLSSMSAHDVRVRTLLIDEGFGTLDPATLDSALAVLDALQATGRQVGVISHVPALVERVGAHVRVSPKGGGRSEVVVAQA